MRNIVDKIETLRTATAMSAIQMSAQTIERLKNNDLPKKDVLPIAKAAGVMAAKKTSELIPYCHQISIDHVDIDFEIEEIQVVVKATVAAIWKTGVEMEALMAANVATLTIYDMLKPVDKDMEIVQTKVISKKGGKSDFKEWLPKEFRAAIIVTSDGTYNKTREDKSGKIIREKLLELGIANIDYMVLPDERGQIRNQLLKFCNDGVALIITTGGTGLGPRDVTVEATREVIEREMPAVSMAMQAYGQRLTPYAMLSRGLAGVRGKTVIVNLPGSSRGTKEGLNALFPALFHVYQMMASGGH